MECRTPHHRNTEPEKNRPLAPFFRRKHVEYFYFYCRKVCCGESVATLHIFTELLVDRYAPGYAVGSTGDAGTLREPDPLTRRGVPYWGQPYWGQPYWAQPYFVAPMKRA